MHKEFIIKRRKEQAFVCKPDKETDSEVTPLQSHMLRCLYVQKVKGKT
jgi:hypothetical protein